MKNKVPKLRFPEFSGEWKINKIKEIAPLQRGFDLTNSQLKEGIYPVVYSNGVSNYHNEFKVNGPGVVTGRSGTIGKIHFIEQNYWPHNTSLWVTNFYNNYPKYIYYLYHHMGIDRFSSGSGVPTLNRNDVHDYKVATPSLPEQEKIANFLSYVDLKIDKLEKKKELLEKYKKGMMQKLFSQKLRFKDDNGNDYPEWQEKKLGEIGQTLNGLTGKTKEDFGNGKPYITYKSIFDSDKINLKKVEYVNIEENENQNRVKYGDIFFTTSSETPNEVGMTSVLLENIDECYLNSFCFCFRLEKLSKVLPNFMRFYMRNQNIRREICKLAQGSTRYNLSKIELMKLEINLPSLPEQEKIANFLSTIDEKIELVKEELEKNKEFKKGLLQQMFV